MSGQIATFKPLVRIMLESVKIRGSLLVLLLAIAMLQVASVVQAQSVLPRAGRAFTFGIIEGPDNLLGDSAQSGTKLTLTVISQYSGCGVVQSPNGFIQNFNFISGTPTIIDLPYNLLQFHDQGKSNKGLLVKTTEPVNLFLHDYVAYAGDGTQLLPDNALDTSYVTFGWGIWDDPFGNEHNNCEFLVTAAYDGTVVTITPSVNTMLGEPAHVPITVTLNQGESYIVKADTSDHPSDPSLSGSTVHSNKPVSVISGLSCGYVPLEAESCNEMMDELVGKKWWGTHFFAPPLGATDTVVEVVLTSDQPFVASINDGFVGSVNNRIRALASGTAEIRIYSQTSGPPPLVEAHQLAQGNQVAVKGFLGGISDPTLVTLLDTAYYTDTLFWNTPAFGGFQNWAPLVFPTTAFGSIQLDGRPLSSLGVAPIVIHNSEYSAITPSVFPGAHIVTSPVPIFGLVTGFDLADAYSYMAGGVAPPAVHDSVVHSILLTADSATTCANFGVNVTLSTPITSSEGIFSLSVPVSYDPSVLHLVGIEPHTMLNSNRYFIDSSIAGTVIVTVLGEPYVTGSDLFKVQFEGWKSVSSTIVGKNDIPTACGDAVENITLNPVTFAVHAPADIDRKFHLSNTQASVCRPVTISLLADAVVKPEDELVLSKIEIKYDTSMQHFLLSQPGSMLLPTEFSESGQIKGDYVFAEQAPTIVSGNDTLLTLQLTPSAAAGPATIHATIFYLRCGDTVKQDISLSYHVSYIYDSTLTQLSIMTSPVSLGNQASATVTLSGLPTNSKVKQFDLYVAYNHNVITYDHAVLAGTLTGAWPTPSLSSGIDTDTLHFSSPADLGTDGTLAYLYFRTYVSDSSFTPIVVGSSLTGVESDCPTIFSSVASTVFLGKGLCGDTLLRTVMLGERFTLDYAGLGPDGTLTLTFHSPIQQTVDVTVVDALGRIIWQGQIPCQTGTNEQQIPLPVHLPSGSFIVRAEATGTITSKRILFIK